MGYKTNTPSITVLRADGTSSIYDYDWTSNVGTIRKGDALLINEGKATAFYTAKPHLTFTSATFYPKAKKWYVKSNRSRSVK